MTAITKPVAGRRVSMIVAALALAAIGAAATLVATGTFAAPATDVAPAESSRQADPAVTFLEQSVNQVDILPASETAPDASAWYGSAFAGEQTARPVPWTGGYTEAFSSQTSGN